MPLIKSASPEALGENIKREEAAGRPYRQSLAIALSTQDRARGRASGGGAADKAVRLARVKRDMGGATDDDDFVASLGTSVKPAPGDPEDKTRGMRAFETRDNNVIHPNGYVRGKGMNDSTEGSLPISGKSPERDLKRGGRDTGAGTDLRYAPSVSDEDVAALRRSPLATAISKTKQEPEEANPSLSGNLGRGERELQLMYRKNIGFAKGGGVSLSDRAYRLAKTMAREMEKKSEGGGLASGGLPEVPYFERSELRNLEYNDTHPGGLVAGAGPGRTDTVNTNVRSGSYVLPADVISGLGSGNSAFGANVIDKMLHTMPYGIQAPKIGHGGIGIPRPPAAFRDDTIHSVYPEHFAQGGEKDGVVPVKLAGGEIVINPEDVMAIGGGDLKRGYKVLDQFVLEARKRNIGDLKGLPGPKKATEK